MTHKPSHGLSDIARDFLFTDLITRASDFNRRYANYQRGKSWKTKRSILKLQSYDESYDFQIVRFNGTGA